MTYLELKGVTFKYPNNFTAVEDVSMSFELGEKVAIVGQNGAGKTTTVKMMNGLIKPTIGDVLIKGESTKRYTTAQLSKNVGYVFQNPDDQIFHNNILNEIKFGPKILGFPPEKEQEMVNLAVELTELGDFTNENPYNVPLPIRKFITIAAVIAMDTDILIFDEPTAGQDLDAINQLSKIINYLQEIGKTVITITHDMEFVVNNFNRIIIMAHKNVLADSNAKDIFWRHDLLHESMLKQPAISQVAYHTGIGKDIIHVHELIHEIKQKIDKTVYKS